MHEELIFGTKILILVSAAFLALAFRTLADLSKAYSFMLQKDTNWKLLMPSALLYIIGAVVVVYYYNEPGFTMFPDLPATICFFLSGALFFAATSRLVGLIEVDR